MQSVDTRLPVTVLPGFLGAWQTMFPDQLPRNREGRRIAAVVDDIREINFDRAPNRDAQ